MILAGIQIMMSGLIDSRKTCVIGISLILGLSVDMLPEAYRGAYPALQPFFSFSLSLATVSVILLTFCCASELASARNWNCSPPGANFRWVLASTNSTWIYWI